MQHVLILDIGKTNVKVLVLNEALDAVFERRRPNPVLSADPYPHYDVDGIWE
jgi:sugar (pentulose or hexulose) kinase